MSRVWRGKGQEQILTKQDSETRKIILIFR